MKKLLVIASLMLNGCASTPIELRQNAAPLSFNSASAPSKVATCLTRNVENFSSALNAVSRENDARYEVIARTSSNYLWMVGDINPEVTGGSSIQIRFSYHVLGQQQQVASKLLEGC
jgi:starvation-inducible outer membrane lipoprotein